ncbi:hypothetical protein LC048_07660 [Mesobacillus subterraneus]|uniref:hypothetical protein n=1 Tax=Mesobacillus subterraneus TaxID=285983 RepID=UPI001CFCE556|nr:hypothetical protein [Mesobacillus subterraneus]WLR56746.1 hypothetical protein LC048_07660 [Mesobacillus subterraneus]
MLAVNYEKILDEYRNIWNNRRLQSEQSPEAILKEAIQRDLKDENSHPRARRTLMEKYFLATKRILEASLTSESKVILLQLHKEMVEGIQDEAAK